MPTDNFHKEDRNVIEALFQQAVTQYKHGHLSQSETVVQKLLELNENHAGALHLVGVIKSHLGQYKSALKFLAHAASINPLQPDVYNNLGFVLHLEGRLEDARAACMQAVSLNPNFSEAFNTLAVVLMDMGKLDQALEACTHATEIKPDFADAFNTLSVILKDKGRFDEALIACSRAIKINPSFAIAHNNAGVIFMCMGRLDESLAAYDRVLKIKPDHIDALDSRAMALSKAGRLFDALDACERAIEVNPARSMAHSNLGSILMDLRQFDKAAQSYNRALDLDPENAIAHSNLLFLLAAEARLEFGEIIEQQKQYEHRHGKNGRENLFPSCTAKDFPVRRLRIGYVSPDFRRHPVSYFFEPLLAAHDRANFEVFCYANHSKISSDATTNRLCRIAEHWRFISDKSDCEIAHLIRSDKIDILVDLAGHTMGNRLKAFTYKPAPVQVTYLGFFASSGLKTMDYWMTDKVLHPLDTREPAVENIYRLPRCSFAYAPPVDAPDVSQRPDNGDQIVFGSFNNLSKLSSRVIEVWSEILKTLPDSALLLMDKYMLDPKVRQLLRQEFSMNNIASERIIFRERVPFREYLAAYADVDIALDPFPRTGGATTAEALWMGVPVVTLAGKCYVERISASKLAAIGSHELIANSEDNYIHVAVSLSKNARLRKTLRMNLRHRMIKSPLCNGVTLAKEIEAAYTSMWNSWWHDESTSTPGH